MSRFPTTQWTLIDLASCESTTGSREQMGQLLESYRNPMYLHLRSRGAPHEKAEDLIQDFTIEILNKDLLSIADPTRGKFRTLLLTALDRFMVGRYRYDTAAKRSPGELMSLDTAQASEAKANVASPADVFERAWALDVLAQTLAEMQRQCEESGDAARWLVFEQRVVAPLLDDTPKPEYDDLAQQFKLKDGKAAMNLLVTAKRQFARVLRELVTDYVTRSADAQAKSRVVASQLTRGNTDADVAARVATHMVQQHIRQAVETEIRQLQTILAQSRSVADATSIQGSPEGESTLKAAFWDRLSGRTPKSALESLLDVDSEEGETLPLDAYFTAILNSDVTEFSGLKVEDEGSLIGVLSGETRLDSLKAVKEWSNLLRASRDKTLPPDLASGVYYLTLAIAATQHGEKITGMSDQSLQAGFIWLRDQPWLDTRVRHVVESAIES